MNNNVEISTEVLKTLRKIMRAIDLQSKKLVRNYGLTVPQILILKELDEETGITVGEIATNINLSQSTVTNILDRLEGRDYVSRTRSAKDKRRVYIKIAEKGIEILKKRPISPSRGFYRAISETEGLGADPYLIFPPESRRYDGRNRDGRTSDA